MISWIWNLERRNLTFNVYSLFIYSFFYVLRFLHLWNQFFRFWILQKKIYQDSIKDFTSDSFEFIWFHISTEPNLRAKIFEFLNIFGKFKKKQIDRKNFERNCQKDIRIKKFSRFRLFLGFEDFKIKNLANVEGYYHNE